MAWHADASKPPWRGPTSRRLYGRRSSPTSHIGARTPSEVRRPHTASMAPPSANTRTATWHASLPLAAHATTGTGWGWGASGMARPLALAELARHASVASAEWPDGVFGAGRIGRTWTVSPCPQRDWPDRERAIDDYFIWQFGSLLSLQHSASVRQRVFGRGCRTKPGAWSLEGPPDYALPATAIASRTAGGPLARCGFRGGLAGGTAHGLRAGSTATGRRRRCFGAGQSRPVRSGRGEIEATGPARALRGARRSRARMIGGQGFPEVCRGSRS